MTTYPKPILELSHYPYFPSILGLQICPRCEKPHRLHQFWREKKATWCKNCQRCRKVNYKREKQASYQKTSRYREYAAQWMRTYRKTSTGAEQNRKDNRAYAARYPHKRRAHAAVANALQSGRLTRQPCQVCGDPKAEAHHPDYSKPLEVIWLCIKDHKELHYSHLTAEENAIIIQLMTDQ